MPRVHYVKKARKDNPAVKAGEPYYFWEFRYGGKRYSKTRPRPSQLTQSEFLSRSLAMQETIEDFEGGIDELESLRDDLANEAGELADLADESRDAMPEGLQEGDTGQMLEQRAEDMRSIQSELESIDVDFDEDEAREVVLNELGEDADESDIRAAMDEKRQERVDEILDELRNAAEYTGE